MPRKLPTPKLTLLYDEHRDAIAEALDKYTRPYARFTFAVTRLQEIFYLATRWKDPCILAYPWMKEVFGIMAHPFSAGARKRNAVRDPFEVDQVTYRMLHVCVKTSEWLAATERERLDYNSIFRADFAKVKSIVEKIAGALPEEWIKDDQYMKDGFWRFFFDLDESTGLYSFRDELPSALRDCCVECPYDKTVNLHLAEDDGRFNLAFVAIEGMYKCIRECTAHLRAGKANGHVWLSPQYLSAIFHPFSFRFLDATKPPPGIRTPLTFCHDMFDMIQRGIADWGDFIDALSEALPGSSVFMALTSSFNSMMSLFSGIFAFTDMAVPTGREKAAYQHELDRFTGLLERAGQELFEREAQAANPKQDGFTPEDRRRLRRIEQASVFNQTPTESQHAGNVRRQQVEYGAKLYRPSTKFKRGFSFAQAAKAAINSPDFRDAEGAYSLSEKKSLTQAIRRYVRRGESDPAT